MDWTAIALSVRLAAIVAFILLVIGLPIAYWLTFSRSRWTFLVESVVSLPLVLPPTVLGFYVLLAIGSRSPERLTTRTDSPRRARASATAIPPAPAPSTTWSPAASPPPVRGRA